MTTNGRNWSNFTSSLKYLVYSGANVSQKNNDGLVPFQLALFSYGSQYQLEPRYLYSLIPSNEALSELVPWSTSIIGTVLIEFSKRQPFIPLLERLAERGLNCSHEQVFSTAFALKNVKGFKFEKLLACLLKVGARPTINDVIQAMSRESSAITPWSHSAMSRDKTTFQSYIEHLPDELVGRLNDAAPGLVELLISQRSSQSRGELGLTTLNRLLVKGFQLKVDDLRRALESLTENQFHDIGRTVRTTILF